MGLFEKIFTKQAEKEAHLAHDTFRTLTAYRPAFTSWNGSIYESELVRSAIDARARNISKLKVEIVGSANQKLQTKLKLKPNNFQTWSQFMYRSSTILDMDNTLIIVPIYDDFYEVVGYYPILPRRCEVIDVDGEAWLRYEFNNGQRASERLSNVAMMTKFQYKSDFFGTLNDAMDTTMKLIHLENQNIEEAVKSGATFRFMARVTNFTSPDDLARERIRFNEENLKAEDGSGLLLFPNTYSDIKQIDSKPYTVSEQELKNINSNVMNYFAINEDVIQSRAFGDSWSAFYESVIEPFAIQFSETMTKAIFTEREIAQGSFLMATSNRLQYLTTSEKLNVSAQLADRGILSINEIREIWNLPPVENGDTRTIRGEYYSVDDKLSLESEGNEQENEQEN